MSYHLTPVRMAIIKIPQIINAREGVEKTEHSYNVCGNVNWYYHYGEQSGGFLKTIELPYDLAILLLGIFLEKKKTKQTIIQGIQEFPSWHSRNKSE